MRASLLLVVTALVCVGHTASSSSRNGIKGWNIMTTDWVTGTGVEDALAIEWDYFMIHSETFSGIIGYVLVDPRLKLCPVTPCGANVAFAGAFLKSGSKPQQFKDGETFLSFTEFGANFTASGTEKSYKAWGVKNNEARKAAIESGVNANGTQFLLLTGDDSTYKWSFKVTADWTNRFPKYNSVGAFVPTTATDLGKLPLIRTLEKWTVDMVWPRTKVVGTVTNLKTGEKVHVDGHGYRENSWGHFVLTLGGWDFAVFSSDESGVMFGWQTYHESLELSFLDVSFYDKGKLKVSTFRAPDALQWEHGDWIYHEEAMACVPTDTTVRADDGEYRVEAHWEYRELNQLAMLSSISPISHAYVIMEHFPYMKGRIVRSKTGEVVTKFEGWMGGEYSIMREPRQDKCSTGVGRLTHRIPSVAMALLTAYKFDHAVSLLSNTFALQYCAAVLAMVTAIWLLVSCRSCSSPGKVKTN